MKIYTFMLEYEGTTMVRQLHASDEVAAVRALGGLMSDEMSPEWGNGIGQEMPVPVDDMESVWCISCLIADHLLLGHFTVTAG